jgi:protein-tyrosine phosphatase
VELNQVSSDVASLVAQGEVVYIHCRVGVQRAPLVACAGLMQMGWSLPDPTAWSMRGERSQL